MARPVRWQLALAAASIAAGGCFYSVPDLVEKATSGDGGASVFDASGGSIPDPEGHFCHGFDDDGGFCADFDDGKVPSFLQVLATDPGAVIAVADGALRVAVAAATSPRTAEVSVRIPGSGPVRVELDVIVLAGRLEVDAGTADLLAVDAPPAVTGAPGQSLRIALVGGAADNEVLPALDQSTSGGTSTFSESPAPFATAARHHLLLEQKDGTSRVSVDGAPVFEQTPLPQGYDAVGRTLRLGVRTSGGAAPAIELRVDDVVVRYR